MPFVTKEFFLTDSTKAFMFLENSLGYSSKEAQKIIDKARLYYPNGEIIKKSQVIFGKVCLDVFEPQVFLKPIFVHRDFAIFHKPYNLLTHPKGKFSHQSLCDSIKGIFGKDANPVHRLDFETSGIILASLHKDAEIKLKKMFEANMVRKIYRAWVWGRIEKEMMIDLKILSPNKEQKKQSLGIRSRIDKNGKEALTFIKPLDIREDRTLLEIFPITGRTHQIRIHLFAIGHSIINEPLYGVDDKEACLYLDHKLESKKQLFLHARSLDFCYEGQRYFFSVDENFLDLGK
ncbi:RluA family pseudouridine synthase [Helicobacter anatolicus]|uniref:RluA family pseudouridine synthase n=1 Tax=Helicobacter anatolicus TaxID=2905874 RepID=UPI001E4ECE3B|nr:RluA family pseudouridine synthase [Helicobacter anatolicus]MCE3038615.1 RluA family pseudouridine synthase [Helicobacter anatolicus]